MRQVYINQVDLLLRCLPQIEKEDSFAIKGGTALNLFLCNMPRLSVDIDLVYLPIAPREPSLAGITEAMLRIKGRIEKAIPGAVVDAPSSTEIQVARLLVWRGDAHVKVEPNTIIRGSVFAPVSMDLCQAAQHRFEVYVSSRVLSRADLYGGKICAALDRQHPRDLFDIKLLLDAEGLDDDVRTAFVIYLASHNRTMHELLAPTYKDIRPAYESTFVGMIDSPPSIEELEAARDALVERVNADLSEGEREFLLSIKRGQPQWDRLPLDHVAELPGLRWKLLNIQRMDKKKHAAALASLEKVLAR